MIAPGFVCYTGIGSNAGKRGGSSLHYADYKTILSPQNGMNLYRGCTHGCIYCDSRSKCYQFDHAFEDIEVKRDAARILAAQLKKKRARCMISTGSMCDPYIPLEERLLVTRQALEVIDRLGFGATVLTKSARVLRDIDLFQSIHQKAKFVVQMTLTTYDEALCRQIEPNVSTTKERFVALETLRDAGIPTVIWLSPVLPFLNDTEENLRGILDYCVRADVKGIICFGFGMTLRDGDREYFYAALDRLFPGMKQRYIEAFGSAYVCNSPNEEALSRIFHEVCETHGILHTPNDVFRYLGTLEPKQEQMALFE